MTDDDLIKTLEREAYEVCEHGQVAGLDWKPEDMTQWKAAARIRELKTLLVECEEFISSRIEDYDAVAYELIAKLRGDKE